MAALVSTIEVARPQADVYSYVTDPSRFVEWHAQRRDSMSGRDVAMSHAA